MKKSNSIRGKKARATGARFEAKVRQQLEEMGWIIDRWTNNVDLELKKIVKAKRKYNPFLKFLSIGTGFPDFVCFKRAGTKYDIIGVEVKKNGWLDKIEKEKCKFILNNKIFSKILIAKNGKERGNVEYINFKEKYGLV